VTGRTDRDEVTELANRVQARQRRGETWDLEFEIEWHSLTDEERKRVRGADGPAGREKLETLVENNRILALLLAYDQRTITAMDFVERVRGAVLDELVGQKPG
jgi:hypothetical protein